MSVTEGGTDAGDLDFRVPGVEHRCPQFWVHNPPLELGTATKQVVILPSL